jgi:DNA-binding NarL/FixJ family response regulator
MAAVIVIDGHRARAEAVGLAVTVQPGLELVATVRTAEDAVHEIRRRRVDIVVLGQLELASRIPELRDAAGGHELVPVVMLDEPDRVRDVQAAVEAGAMGFVAPQDSLEHLVAVARSAASGRVVLTSPTLVALLAAGAAADVDRGSDGPVAPAPATPAPLVIDERAVQRARDRFGLTAREADVLQLLGEGLDAQTIARQLIMSVHTARGHLKSLMMKLNAHSQVELLVVATRQGLLPSLAGGPAATPVGAAPGRRHTA